MTHSQLRKIPQFFRRSRKNAGGWSSLAPRDRLWEEAYRSRWQHDKVVRSTHGVNCTGSCSWQIYVKDGIITWETQQTDYPTNGPSMPEYEPRGCPRGASFSWYVYSPLRIRYPYVRSALWRLWKQSLADASGDELEAWRRIVEDPSKCSTYKKARGMGGFIRVEAEDLYRLISASLIYTVKKYGPDRIFGFTPIPAMSMVSYAAGSRFISLLGGGIISFYDWYCDLPIASPEVWGEQTDVPESADWYNSSYIVMWGANLPITRTPDAHFMVEARYKGAKVVAVSPDYTDNVKFGDVWLAVRPGTDGALAMAMSHVILKEFYIDRHVEYFEEYASTYTDLPFLVLLEKVSFENEELYAPTNFLTASDLGIKTENSDWKTVLLDSLTGKPVVPNGSIGFRWGQEGKWNLEPVSDGKRIKPMLTILGKEDTILLAAFPYFEEGSPGKILKREVPAKVLAVDGKSYFVTTVFDLLVASTGISRGLKGDYPADYDDPRPYTPSWQERITGVERNTAIQIAREFAKNAEMTRGKSMVIMGSGINHWYHNDQIYRAILSLVLLTGSQGVNGGGWAHYVGQEKVRPLEGWSTLAFAYDWCRPARLQNGTSFFYFATDQWRYEYQNAGIISSPLSGKYGNMHFADYNVIAAKLGWLPSYPQFNTNPIDISIEAEKTGAKTEEQVSAFVAEKLAKGDLKFSIEDPDEPSNFPRILFVWRANLISASGKGHEYFLKHLLGTKNAVLGKEVESLTPSLITLRDAPEGKLDLLVNINFRMDGTALYSDIVLPAATWYEKHDISTTDLHPFIHPFNPAIDPAWESKSDWNTFVDIARVFSEMASRYFVSPFKDVVTIPLMHDTPDEISQPRGRISEWWKNGEKPSPGKNTQRVRIVERDYSSIYSKMVSLGPLITKVGIGAKGVNFNPGDEYEILRKELGEGAIPGCPDLSSAVKVAEAIMALSGATNGFVAMKGWKALEKRTGMKLSDLVEEESGVRIRFEDLVRQPRRVLTTPVWSGIEKGGRQYTAFAVNVERKVPWRTLTGRQHFYLDHQLIREFGDNLPVYRPPLTLEPFLEGESIVKGEKILRTRWITPHNKWSIHTTYSDNLRMLNLFRGGPTVWLNHQDADDIGVADNDWVEVFNRNGVMVARAVVSHRIPRGSAFSYHAQDRTINVPASSITKERGGIHNSVTQIRVKPTHMIGAYAQLSWGFNYWGPVGNQRDTMVFIRKMKEVNWAES